MIRFLPVVLMLGLLGSVTARSAPAASIFTVTTTADSGTGSLREALDSANSDPGSTINFNIPGGGTIHLATDLPMVSVNVTINGQADVTISGQDSHQIFFVAGGTVTIKNLSLVNGLAQGGNGGDGFSGGGGGLGAGGALFVNTGADVTIENVNFLSNSAVGGNGGSSNTTSIGIGGGGGGGFHGDGGTSTNPGGGGGGGFAGDGGNATSLGGGGGGGLLGNGGAASSVGGGGGGGILGDGGASSIGGGGGGGATAGSAAVGTTGGDGSGGAAGGTSGGAGELATIGGGGGGGGGISSNGGAGGGGGVGGGGGGGGAATGGGFSLGGVGGNGATGGGGGGGGGQSGTAGNGGLYGGGGGAGYGFTTTSVGGTAGDFGGGGGAGSANGLFSSGGTGGFGGGGGGAGWSATQQDAGVAGFGGGYGAIENNGGNGGSAYGGAIFVRDGGSLTIAGSGNTLLSGSSLTVGNGGTGNLNNGNPGEAAGTGIYIHDSSTLNFNTSGQFTVYDSIAGIGAVTVTGSGEVVYANTSNNTYTGQTTIYNGATLRLDGTMTGQIFVDAGGALHGTGTAGGGIASFGTVAPGNSIGTLHVTGDYTQGLSGFSIATTLEIEIDPTHSDLLDVSGTAAFNRGSQLKVIAASGNYTVGTRYRILTTSHLLGSFDSWVYPTGFDFDILYDANWIDLLLLSTPFPNYAQYAVTPNQYDVATALNTISQMGLSDFDDVFTALNSLSTPEEYQAAYNQMVGDIYASTAQTQIQTTTTWLQMMSNQFASQMTGGMQTTSSGAGGSLASAGPAPAFRPSTPNGETYLVSYNQPTASGAAPRPVYRRVQSFQNNAWIQGFGLGSDVSGNGNAGGLNFGSGGLMFGVDRWLNDTTFVGLLGGYANASVRDKLVTSNAQVNDYQVGVYAVHGDDDFYFTDIDAYSGGSYTTTRNIAIGPLGSGGINLTAKGNPNTNSWAHYNEFGHTYMNYYDWMVQPFVGLQYIYYKQNGFTESGGGPLSLTVNSLSVNSLRPSIGMRFFQTYTWRGMRVMPILSAQYQRECADGAQLITSSFVGAPTVTYNTGGTYLGRDFGLFGLGSQVFVNPQMSLYGSLDNQVSAHYSAVVGSGGLIYRW